ncbi:MAG TPA: hypothetical protein VFC00_19335 [Micromonosporaceae bacterium]|nr:hypothetical protein [Micromonosporaceae bacterium]
MRTQESVSTKIPHRRASELPAPAQPAPTHRIAAEAVPLFRLPSAGDPAPPVERVGALCGWAAGLGLVGTFIAVRAFVAFFGVVPGWYQPAVVGVGVLGMALTVGAFLAVHQQRLPWWLLSGATAALAANLLLVFSAP